MLGLSDDDDDDQDQDLIREDMSSETSSSPELEMDEPEPETSGNKIDQEIINQVEEEDEEELIPTQHPNEVLQFGEQEDEITVNELTHDEKVEKLEDTIKILQQQMAEGNDHIEYELKMRQEEKANRSLRYAIFFRLRIGCAASYYHNFVVLFSTACNSKTLVCYPTFYVFLPIDNCF